MENYTTKSGNLELKAADSGVMTFSGYASVKNNIDLDGDMIVAGAYHDLEEFVREGSVLPGHEKSGLGVGVITKAIEDEIGLWVEGQFFDTPDAVAVYSKLKARMDAGKSCPMSFGFFLKSWVWEVDDQGKEFRKITALSPKEASFVVVAANPMAGVAAIKGITGMPPDQQFEALLAGLADWTERLSTFEKDRKQGLSDVRIQQLKDIADQCMALFNSCNERRKHREAVLCDLQKAYEKLTA